jgi:hypothetical protein
MVVIIEDVFIIDSLFQKKLLEVKG